MSILSRASARFICLLTVGTCSADELTFDALFPTARILDVQITVDEQDWETIRFQKRDFQSALAPERQFEPPPGPYSYVNAEVSIDGVELGTVGLRKKGFLGSQNTVRPSLKVKLNHVDPNGGVAGLTNLTLNNNQQDTTLMSQVLGYAFFNAAGCPAPRCGYAKVTLNGENLGIYAHVETPRKPLLTRRFGSDKGTLFEGTVTDFFRDWEGSFEKESGKAEPGLEKLRQLIAAFDTPPGNNILSATAEARAWVPTSDAFDDQWTSPDFDDSSWKSGQNGAGYEIQSGYEQHISQAFHFPGEHDNRPTSIYMRLSFDINDVETVKASGNLILRMKYDDGFVAWLNGHKVRAANAPENPIWDSVATEAHGDEAAVQYQSFDISEHEDKLREGRNVLAIQGLNVSKQSTDMLISVELETNDLERERNSRVERIAEVVDMDAFYQFWAIEGLLGFWDGYTANRNNFFVYLNPETGKFHFMPWGADSVFETFSKLRTDPKAPFSVKTQGRVAWAVYQTEEGRERIARTMSKLLSDHWDEEKLLAEVDRIEEMLKPHVALSQKWTFQPERLRTFIRNRRAAITAELEKGLPLYTRPPGPPPVVAAFQGEGKKGKEAKANDKQEMGADTIWNAAHNGDVDAIGQRLARGVKVESRNPGGSTALAVAAAAGKVEAVQFLIRKGADVNTTSQQLLSPLHVAAYHGHLEVVTSLVEAGAKLNVRNQQGQTPLDLAALSYDEVQELVTFFTGLLGGKANAQPQEIARAKVAEYLRGKGARFGFEL